MTLSKYSASVDHRECWGYDCGMCGCAEVDPDPKGNLYRSADVDAALRDLLTRWRAEAQRLHEGASGDPWEAGEHSALLACADALEALLPT